MTLCLRARLLGYTGTLNAVRSIPIEYVTRSQYISLVVPNETGSGGKESRPINSLKNEPDR